ISLLAKVKSLSENKSLDLAASNEFRLNAIDTTDKIEDMHLLKFDSKYVVEMLGRTGEVLPNRPIHFAIKHRDFREPAHVMLKSPRAGGIDLGALADITQVNATGPDGTSHAWYMTQDRHTYRSELNAKAGDTISVPYLGAAGEPSRDDLALFELRGDTYSID